MKNDDNTRDSNTQEITVACLKMFTPKCIKHQCNTQQMEQARDARKIKSQEDHERCEHTKTQQVNRKGRNVKTERRKKRIAYSTKTTAHV